MHKLKILATDKGVDISLDGFLLDFVTGYKVESSADGVTELSLKMVVSLAIVGSVDDTTKIEVDMPEVQNEDN